ncbi:MAG: hypothetical protein RQ866_09390 [Bacteroidales bacterium]|nr:hypothetical protein [Bacteroidales bacterium]
MIKTFILFFFCIICVTVKSFGQNDTISNNTDSIPNYSEAYFPGGIDSLYHYLEENFFISRTEVSYTLNEYLVADIMITINKKGEVIATTAESSNYQLSYALERAFMDIPPFAPATKNGKPVTSYASLKFVFFIKGNRMEVSEHIYFKTISKDSSTNWIKALLVAVAVSVLLLLWGF